MADTDLAAAVAFFQASDDLELLREALRLVRPKAARAVSAFERDDKEPPQPLDVEPAAVPSNQTVAMRYLRGVSDFAALQALSRAIGRRIEEIGLE